MAAMKASLLQKSKNQLESSGGNPFAQKRTVFDGENDEIQIGQFQTISKNNSSGGGFSGLGSSKEKKSVSFDED